MNSRERVLRALNHQEADRVPIDLGGTRQSGIAATSYHALKEKLGIRTPTRVFDVYQMIAEVERPVMERLGADCLGLMPPAVAFGIPNDRYKPWQFPGWPLVEVPAGFNPIAEPDGSLLLWEGKGDRSNLPERPATNLWSVPGFAQIGPVPFSRPLAKMPAGGFYFDRLDKFPGAAHADPEKLALEPISQEECDHYAAQAEAYTENTDYALIVKMGPPYELFFGLGMGDFPAWMITLATEPDYVHALYERLTEVWLENLRRLYAAVGEKVHVVQFNDDLGTQDGPFLSVKMFRELVMPYYKRGLDWIHRHTGWKVFMHNDGAIFSLIPSLIEMGVDAIHPVQTSAKGMDPLKLKREFGDRIVFWGAACDAQGTLAFGTPEEVAREVAESVRIFAPGGGYVLAAVHNVQALVPPENVLALYDTARAARW